MHDVLTPLEYEALRAEERDRMNARTGVWTLYLTIVGAIGALTGISGASPYLAALCPPLLLFLSRHSRHSEDVLKQIRAYLYSLELKNNYTGYEHYTRKAVRPTHGSHMTALRDAFLFTDILSALLVLSAYAPLMLSIAVLLSTLASMVLTWRTLSKRRASVLPVRRRSVHPD